MMTRCGLALLSMTAALGGCATRYETAGQAPVAYDLRAQTFHTFEPSDPLIGRLTKLPFGVWGGGVELEYLIIERQKDQHKERYHQERVVPDPAPPRGGELRARLPDRAVPLPLKHTDVKAQITLHVGSVTVTQKYHNPYDGKIEAVYVFPLPDDAAVRDFVMQIGERQIRGIIREREEAQRIYLEARRQGHVASLLTQDRPNVFTQAVANIEPGKQIDIHITYFHTLRYVDGVFEFHFPMVVGPRYNPSGYRDGVGAAAAGTPGSSGQKTEVQFLRPEEISAHDIALEVDVDAATGIEEVASPTHAIQVERPSPVRARVTLNPHDRIPNKDFVLRFKPAGKGIRAALATHRDAAGGYFVLMLHPPDALSEAPAPARDMIFVIDCSGSMTGDPLAAAKRAMERCLKRLRADDTFTVIRFGNEATHFSAAPVPAAPENVRAGLRFVESLEANGGTEMLPAVRAALAAPVAAGRFRIVSFMTDGLIGNDREVIGEVHRLLGAARVFSFGVGSAPNRYLVEGMARLGRGVSAYVHLDESSQRAVDELYQRVEHPALADLRIDWGAMGVTEVHPDPLPDLFVGRPVILTGRFRGEGAATVRLTGRMAGRPHEMEIAVDLAKPNLQHKALAAVWARGKIASFYDRMTWAPHSMEFGQEIKRVALQFGLLSDFTAFVAVDSLTRTEGQHGTTVVQPVPVPKGVQYETTVEKK